MPIAAKCPSCGASLSETSVLALAPVCAHCGTVITEVGGTLGLTNAYGVNDPTITRKRVEADLAVFCDYRNKYVGMLEACKEQLNWGVERYAKLPQQPELLPLKRVKSTAYSFLKSCVVGFCSNDEGYTWDPAGILFLPVNAILWSFIWVPIMFLKGFYDLVMFVITKIENGSSPFENARRQKAYGSACAVALKAAESVKAAQDHRLRTQICELEGLITTMTEKAEDVRKILKTL
jgi:transcription initiation factor TFIIIB Brf1 subunit/transcription initiation factor TFIIB